jgi:hypothetical protein
VSTEVLMECVRVCLHIHEQVPASISWLVNEGSLMPVVDIVSAVRAAAAAAAEASKKGNKGKTSALNSTTTAAATATAGDAAGAGVFPFKLSRHFCCLTCLLSCTMHTAIDYQRDQTAVVTKACYVRSA